MEEISREAYEQILENMPICCVDMVIHKDGKVLLVYRKNEPEKEKWWVPGGRVFKGERLEEAVRRKTREEVELEAENIKFLSLEEYFSDKAAFEDIKTGTHCIVAVYLVDVSGEVKIDSTSSDYKWIDEVEEDLENYVKKILKKSGVFS